MISQVNGRRRISNRDKVTAEDDALSQIAREAEARLAARRAARAEARQIRMKELERQQKEIYHSQKKWGTLDAKWGHIEQWMEDSERYSRPSRRHASVSDDEERLSVGSRGSLRPSDYSGFLGSGSRTSSRASSARASPVVEERPDRDFLDKGCRTASTLSAATLASLGGASSRRGSCDTSVSVETEASIRDMKDSFSDMEDRYRRAMLSNAQLHNDKMSLFYQVDSLKELIFSLEEELSEARRDFDAKAKECGRERHAHDLLTFQFQQMKDSVKHSEELLREVGQLHRKEDSWTTQISDLQENLEWKEKKIVALERQRGLSDLVEVERDHLRVELAGLRDVVKKHGLQIPADVTTNNDAGQADTDVRADSACRLAQGSSNVGGKSLLELQLKTLLEDRESLLEQVRRLRSQVEQRDGTENVLENGVGTHMLELQRDANRQISDLKFKLVKSEQEVTTLEHNVVRLEGQITRYKSASENSEKVEDELKVEKRKLQRELRAALDHIEELQTSNNHLSKRLEKMKANRNALLAQQ